MAVGSRGERETIIYVPFRDKSGRTLINKLPSSVAPFLVKEGEDVIYVENGVRDLKIKTTPHK